MSDGYLILDDAGRIAQANPTAGRLLAAASDGSVPEDLTGESATEVFDQISYTDRKGDYEGEFAIDEGEQTKYVSAETADLEDDGFVIGQLVTLRDVTERVQARDALRQERDELNTLFANISDPAVEVRFDDQNRPIVQRVNPAFEEVFGYTESQLRGEVIDEYIVPQDRATDAQAMNRRAAEQNAVRDEVVRETAEGEREFLLQVAVPDRESDAAFALYTDITERKQRQRELQQQNQRLEEFASMVSHDLRNPLNVATEYLGIAKRADDPEQFIEEAETSLDRMEAMIEDVLTLAREGEDVAEPDTVELDLVAEMAWDNCDTKEASLQVEDSFRFEADPDRLMELFENLFRNAVEHGGEAVTVRVGQLSGRRGFFVEDDGPGIADHVKDEVFDHGVTTAEDGTGFGMSIVDRIADAHDWDASVADGREGGARFEFTFEDDEEWIDATEA